MRHSRQNGFTLLELLVAMTILAVIGTLGFKGIRKYAAQARHIKAKDHLETVGKGFDHYYLKHGVYPEMGSYEAMVEANSPLVKQDFIPVNWPTKDPWGQPYEGTSTKGNYILKCAGDPFHPEDYDPIQIESGKSSDSPQATPVQGAPPLGGAPK